MLSLARCGDEKAMLFVNSAISIMGIADLVMINRARFISSTFSSVEIRVNCGIFIKIFVHFLGASSNTFFPEALHLFLDYLFNFVLWGSGPISLSNNPDPDPSLFSWCW